MLDLFNYVLAILAYFVNFVSLCFIVVHFASIRLTAGLWAELFHNFGKVFNIYGDLFHNIEEPFNNFGELFNNFGEPFHNFGTLFNNFGNFSHYWRMR